MIGKVFNPRNAEHERFKPIAIWVTTGSGSVVYGGTKYLRELSKGKYLNLFTELARVRRAVKVDTKSVDDRAMELKIRVPDEEFDDEHIVALIGLSKCCLVCTDDLRSLPYLKRKDLYPRGVKPPYIYRSLTDKKHCCAKLIVEICPTRVANYRHGKKSKSRPKAELLN
ncbi:MAG: hypothetical protein WBY44_06105 [Bryobacteraceae bacterium]